MLFWTSSLSHVNKTNMVISGFSHDVDEIFALLGYYAALSGSPVPTFRDNLSVPSSRVKKSKKKVFFLDFLTLQDRTDTSVQDYHSTLPNIPEVRSSHQYRGGSPRLRTVHLYGEATFRHVQRFERLLGLLDP